MKDKIRIRLGAFIQRMINFKNGSDAKLQKDRLAACGKDVMFYPPYRISNPENMRIGDNVHIGANATIRAEGGVTIGDNTHISRNLCLYSVNHRFRDSKFLPYDSDLVHKPVFIGKNVWIGINVCIAPGSHIEDGAVIGMGTVVSGRVPQYAIVASQKWRIVGERDAEHYEQLESQRRYGGINGGEYIPKE